MANGVVKIYYGEGRGKSSSALGNAVLAAAESKEAIIIQFLKEKIPMQEEYLKRFEPELKLFRFAKQDECFEKLTQEQQAEERENLRNGFNYSKKVISTSACDLLVLDEILGLVDENIIEIDEIKNMLEKKPDDMNIILTGRVLPEELRNIADEVYHISQEH
ncbi:cob(I)yrinic acid a,c-diamide adenosyltransferase [Lachnobacterium bovis]|uniref:Cob(I)alamin adenosyltransferase n=1 Tax=Lachnobacterium bovis TaxID=140626 RepID=A0A1H9S1I3_9FIRM|nr:cob(I)yrinic acid a,c-diamide adenosyltransferase [Lachnobacterium bovis]SER78794.1 cob(I)alamin adenosyltransferase [Lachnobacterium bovis]